MQEAPLASLKIRVPPHNLDAEQALLGSVMLRPDAIYEIMDIVHADSFYFDKHRVIFETMLDLFQKHEPIDILSLSSRLKEKELLERVGGTTFLTELSASVPSSANIKHYADIVRKKFMMRELIAASEHISHLGFNEAGVILVSNSSDYPAGKAREEVASALGIAPPRGQISTTMGPGKGAGAQISIDTSRAVSFPETAAGRAAQNFIRTNNGGDATAVRRFIENDVVTQPGDKRTIDERVANFRGMAQQLGKLTLSGILSQTETEIVFAARSTTEGTTTFTITVEPRAPFRITGIRAEAR